MTQTKNIAKLSAIALLVTFSSLTFASESEVGDTLQLSVAETKETLTTLQQELRNKRAKQREWEKRLQKNKNKMIKNIITHLINEFDKRIKEEQEMLDNLTTKLLIENIEAVTYVGILAVDNEEKIIKNEAKITQNQTEIADNKKVINENKQKIDANDKAIKANTAKITTNTANITKNAETIKTNTTAIAQNKNDIAANRAGIEHNAQAIKKVGESAQKMAAQNAALSGLFQPYSVGKFNITAAVGGYNQHAALAVGTGYRFDNNIAVKAALATDFSFKGGVSYNLGVNYEF